MAAHINTFTNVLNVKLDVLFKLYGVKHLSFYCVGFTALIVTDVSFSQFLSEPVLAPWRQLFRFV